MHVVVCNRTSNLLFLSAGLTPQLTEIEFLYTLASLHTLVLEAYLNNNDFRPVDFIRSVLCLLPLVLRGILNPSRFHLPGRLWPAFLAICKRTGYMPPTSDWSDKGLYLDLSMSGTPQFQRNDLCRLAAWVICQDARRCEFVLANRGRLFPQMVALAARDAGECIKGHWPSAPTLVGIHDMARILMVVVSAEEPLSRQLYRRASIRVNEAYGPRAAQAFWELARLPMEHYWRPHLEDHEELFQNSQIQELLCQGEGS
uniref:P0 n=1 Tax=Luffa aphid-borne yellows virus TaxID=1462682 RepID=A0A411NPX4_9VIRU|nr:P0 [Luffa aphid-borne yellows virus]